MSGDGRLYRWVALGFVAGVVVANVLGLLCTIEGPPRTVAIWGDDAAATLGLTSTALVIAAGLVHGGLAAFRPKPGGAAPASGHALAFGAAFASGLVLDLSALAVTLLHLPPRWSVRLTRPFDLYEWPMSMAFIPRVVSVAVVPALFAAVWVIGAILGTLIRLTSNK